MEAGSSLWMAARRGDAGGRANGKLDQQDNSIDGAPSMHGLVKGLCDGSNVKMRMQLFNN
jgi:hypothetical protein